MNTKLFWLLPVLMLIITACSAAPKWVNNPRSVLDYDDYFIGIGSGASYQAALVNAQTDLAQQITVKVESVVELKSLNLETGGREFYAESIEKNSRITVDQVLKGLTVARQEQEKQTYWVMVTLNKTLMLQSLRGELDKLYSSAETLFNDGMKLAQEGKILTGIKNIMDAQAILPEFYTKKTFYDSFAPNPYPLSGMLSIASLESGIRTILTSVVFEVLSGDRQSAISGKELPEPVTFAAIYRSRSGERVPLSGYPVKVVYGDNTLLSKGATDNQGRYTVNVIATPQSGSRGKIIIKSDAIMLPSYMSKNAEQSIAEAYYSVGESQGFSTQLVIKDEKGMRLERVERNLTKQLNSNNVSIAANSTALMQGTVAIVENKMVEGIGSPKRLVKVRLDLSLGGSKTKEFYGSISGSGQGMSDKDEKEAIFKAYDSIVLNNRELAQLIATVSPKLANQPLAVEPEKKPEPQLMKPLQTESLQKPEQKPSPDMIKDAHWFTSSDRLYTTEEFTQRTYKLWARVGRYISESGRGFAISYKVLDYEKNIELNTEYCHQTIAGEINNIKKDDLVFVFHTYSAPESEKQAKTQQWEMVRVTDAKELLNGKVYVSSNNWAPVSAIRVLKK